VRGRWVEVRRTYTAPQNFKRLRTYGNWDADLDRLVFGVTVIEYRDVKDRRRPKFVEVIGDQRRCITL
jgi:hypothetical protein